MNMIISYHKIKKIIEKWLEEAHVNQPVMFKVDNQSLIIYICTNKAGYMIGCAGILVDKYTNIFKKQINENISIKLIDSEIVYSYYKKEV